MRKQSTGMEGRLPSMAPLANPYVPFQLEDPPKYEPRRGMIRGTLFPGLDLPFHGMVNTQEKKVTPMSEMQALNFAIQELALYLDTHCNDTEALELYQQYQKHYAKFAEEQAMQCRPMNHLMQAKGDRYAWLDDPWPWEFCANKEV